MEAMPLIIGRFVTHVFPEVSKEIRKWIGHANAIPEPVLREQALASITAKRFHAQGGSVYACYTPGRLSELVTFIVAMQTVSDYLDNLCDRTPYREASGFRQLHKAMVQTVETRSAMTDYYSEYPWGDDGGYLNSLVGTCRTILNGFPTYSIAETDATRLMGLYSDLQVYKHLPKEVREDAVIKWIETDITGYPDTRWWELACATGSTLGVFALVAMSTTTDMTKDDTNAIVGAYFPWICGLHILLDYLIDLEEDAREGDMNFVAYYEDREQAAQRLAYFVDKSFAVVESLPRPSFHRAVLLGLLAMYLSDRKVAEQRLHKVASALLDAAGPKARPLLAVCKQLRWLGAVR